MDGYSKKKYVCKLLFIFLLGHDIDFGHMEAVNLLSSNKYTEKQIVSVGAARPPCFRVITCESVRTAPSRRSVVSASGLINTFVPNVFIAVPLVSLSRRPGGFF